MRDFKTRRELAEIQARAQQIIEEKGWTQYKGKSGLYFIKLYDIIIYVGSSKTDLAYRIARHKMHIEDPNDEPEIKYDVLREICQRCPHAITVSIVEDNDFFLEWKEDELIDEYKPPLNSVYPIYNYFNGKIPVGHTCRKKEDYPTASEVIEYVEEKLKNRTM